MVLHNDALDPLRAPLSTPLVTASSSPLPIAAPSLSSGAPSLVTPLEPSLPTSADSSSASFFARVEHSHARSREKMTARANNEAHRTFRVGQRVLLKNRKRDRQGLPLYHNPGVITVVKDGAFTIELEAGGTTTVGAQLIRHCPSGPLSVPMESEEVPGEPSSSSRSSQGDEEGNESDEDGDEEAQQRAEATTASSNMIVVSDFFAASSAPKNFANSMRNVSGKRQRKKPRHSDEMDFEQPQ